MKINHKISLLSIVILFAGGACSMPYFAGKKAIHIAFVAGLSGENALNGKSLVEGARLYVDRVNRQGGINGRKVVLDVFDDQNDPEIAQQKALEIAQQNQAIAVIGHRFSSASLSGGEIYKKHHIPAVTPFSTNVKVTQDNKWYFRTIFDDQLQCRFLAHYVKNVFHQKTVSIIHSDETYGAYIAQLFSQTARDLDIQVKYQWVFQTHDVSVEQTLSKIARELKAKSAEAGVIFLATHAKDGVKLVKFIKELGIKNVMVAPDAFASKTFLQGFNKYPKEQRNPGYYTDGLYVAAPLIFDSANKQALQFKEIYQTTYEGEVADWQTAFAYDAVMMLIYAIKNAGISGTNLVEDRQKLRDYLANLTHIDKAIEGVAGFNYFDEHGDAQKPVSIGVYKNGALISALTQFRDVPNLSDISNLQAAHRDKRVLLMGDKYMYKTHVVYTGIKINEISEVDLTTLTYALDFYLWFRFQGTINPQNLEFWNAVKPIQLGEPIEEEVEGHMNYRLYHVKGRFKTNFLSKSNLFGLHMFGVSFLHRKLPRYNLIYVRDALGMALFTKDSLVEKLQQAQVLSPKYKAIITQTWLFQDITLKDSLGNPKYLKAQDAGVEYSRFNMGIMVKEDKLSLLYLISREAAAIIWVLSLFVIILLLIVSQHYSFQDFLAWFYFFQMIFVFPLLLSTEIILGNWLMAPHIQASYLKATVMVFDILWWVIGAIFVHIASNYLLWKPIDKKTGRSIPKVVHHFWVFTIYALALFGIVGFVFERALTSLLATSGVIVMIIGLAVKMNLSNIFSGLAINVERPFRIGDWVKIGSYEEGIIEDVNWRATRICTRTGLSLIIPNSTVAESDILNFSSKENFWFRPAIYVDPRHPPEIVRKILDEALLSVEGILKEPAPFSVYEGINDWAAGYWMYVCLDDYGKKFRVLQSVWENAWVALSRAGIQPAIRRQEIYAFRGEKERKWVPAIINEE